MGCKRRNDENEEREMTEFFITVENGGLGGQRDLRREKRRSYES